MRAVVTLALVALAVVGSPSAVAAPLPGSATVPDFRSVETATRTAGDDAYDILGRWSGNQEARQPAGAGVSTGDCFEEPDAQGCEGWSPAEARRARR